MRPTCRQDSIGDLSDAVYCMVLFKSMWVCPRKRTFYQRWEKEGLSPRAFETPYDNVGRFKFEELSVRMWDWDCTDPWVHS
jgi:hypothetical protein